MQDNIGGVILFDETIRQSAADGTLLVDLIKNKGALPGIKAVSYTHLTLPPLLLV